MRPLAADERRRREGGLICGLVLPGAGQGVFRVVVTSIVAGKAPAHTEAALTPLP